MNTNNDIRQGNIVLGIDVNTGKQVTASYQDRSIGNLYIGSIGTGKMNVLSLQTINQDLKNMVSYINNSPSGEGNDTQDFLGGLSVFDTSHEFCGQVLQLVKSHNISEKAVTYIDPTNPNTPSINPMKGSVDKVAEVFIQVISGLIESESNGRFSLKQSQRNHLKNYIYLLKLHDEEKLVTLDMLLDMYNNPQLVRDMHVKFKCTFPADYESFKDRDERNYWRILRDIDGWFDLNLLPKMKKVGDGEFAEKNELGEIVYFDALSDHVRDLRSVLNDIGSNLLIRRVLFGEGNFDFDTHIEMGGVLLVNTAKDEVGSMSSVFAQLVLMNLQQAVLQRIPNDISLYHHIFTRNASDYLYKDFIELTMRSRMYKLIITITSQSIKQFEHTLGQYSNALLGAVSNVILFGDISKFDLDYYKLDSSYQFQEAFHSTVLSSRHPSIKHLSHTFVNASDFSGA